MLNKMKYCGVVTDPSWDEAWKKLKGKMVVVQAFPKLSQEKMCGQKKQYSSETMALNEIQQMSKHKYITSVANIYRCPFCSYWHVGKNKLFRKF
jgi:hypothetical protein